MVARPLRDALGIDGSVARGVLLWFGGRNEDIRWTPALASWLGPEFAVAAFAYRGRGGSAGRATQPAVVDDGLRIVHWLLREGRFEGARLVIAGRSLGSAVARQVVDRLGAAVPLVGLVLLSPMDSLHAVLRGHRLPAPVVRWLAGPFDSLPAAGAVRVPTLVLLAERDERVPHDRSRRLVEALSARPGAGRIDVRTVAGTDHRSLPRSAAAQAAIGAFTAGLAV